MEVGVSHHDLTGMKMRVERACVSQGDEQPAWRGVEKVYDLFGRTASYADNACARALVAAAQPSQFTPGRGNRQESSRDGARTHVIPLACDVPAGPVVSFLPVLESLEALSRCRSGIAPSEQHFGDISVRDRNLTSGTGLEQLDKRFARASVTVEEIAGQGVVVIRLDGNVAAVVEGPFDESSTTSLPAP